MATCPACAKTTAGDKPTCYFCGAFLVPRVECPKCHRAIPQTRPSCHYCGSSLVGAKLAAADTAAKAPVKLDTSKVELEPPTPWQAWLSRNQTTIDLTLFVVAAPMALGAMAAQAVLGTLARMMRAGRS